MALSITSKWQSAIRAKVKLRRAETLVAEIAATASGDQLQFANVNYLPKSADAVVRMLANPP